MIRYEWKKLFGSRGGKAALLLLAGIVLLNCWTATNAYGTGWINEQGEEETGRAAAARLREVRKEWAGPLDTERLTAALEENHRINATPEARSGNAAMNNIAYGWKQGIADIRDCINNFLAEDFHTSDYYRADSLQTEVLAEFYPNRLRMLQEFLYEKDSNADHLYSESEKNWIIQQYLDLETPMYYDYYEGWQQLCENSVLLTMSCSMILGYLMAGIFANEFKWKADSVYFSSVLGRTAGTKAKIRAGFWLVSITYWICMLIYSLYTLSYLGFDGWNCPIQLDRWKCFYNITFLEKYLLILAGGYLGNLFSAFLVMWISARTRTALIAVTLPFLFVFLPVFLQNYEEGWIGKILGLLPNRLLEIGNALNYFDVYSIGDFVTGALPVLFVLYLVITAVLVPVMYREFGRAEIR